MKRYDKFRWIPIMAVEYRLVGKSHGFRQMSHFIFDMTQDGAYSGTPIEHVCDLFNGAIFSDLEQLITQISRARPYVTLNIREMVQVFWLMKDIPSIHVYFSKTYLQRF